MFINWWFNSNTLFLASNELTSNFQPNRAFTGITKSLIDLTWTSFFQTSDQLEPVHLLVIELKHPIFGFKRSNIELRTLFDPSIQIFRRYWIWQVLKWSIHKKILYVTVKAQISVIMGFEQLQEVERRTIDFHCFICQFWYNDIIIIINHVGL